jgi:hypothetical protein
MSEVFKLFIISVAIYIWFGFLWAVFDGGIK